MITNYVLGDRLTKIHLRIVRVRNAWLLAVVAIACNFSLLACPASAQTIELEYAPSAVANPLKGLVPYSGARTESFPHSMEFNYLAYGDLVKGYEDFDWQAMETLLNDVASRGHQTIFRIYLEYPGKLGVIPKFLIEDGLVVHRYLNTNTQPLPPQDIETPDYNDKNLRRSLGNFVRAMGARYDGDPRIGFITAGLLGTWGEWHTFPRDDLFASPTVQAEVMDAYTEAFKKTPVLLRYPAGDGSEEHASNAKRPFGYHDDSFAWATLHTGKPSEDWFYMTVLEKAGALAKWREHPIGGEIRPEAWGQVFDAKPKNKKVQDFRKCVDATHASWLMDTGMFEKRPSQDRRRRAEQEVQRMGYEFHVSKVVFGKLADRQLPVTITLENRGVAPFYVDWPAEIAVIENGKLIATQSTKGKITGVIPGEPLTVWQESLPIESLSKGSYKIAIRVANPLSGGLPVRFANSTQDKDIAGWMTLGEWQKN